MWEEYANQNTGICIGYNTRELFRFVGGGGEVQYVNELPIILPEPFMHFAEAMRNRVYCKLREYEYEEEYRTRKFSPNILTLADRQVKLPKEVFNKVILGSKVSDVHRKEIIENVKLYVGEIEIIEK